MEIRIPHSSKSFGDFSIFIRPAENEKYCELKLNIKYTLGYPSKVPELSISETSGITLKKRLELERRIKKVAEEFAENETESIYEIINLLVVELEKINAINKRMEKKGSLIDQIRENQKGSTILKI